MLSMFAVILIECNPSNSLELWQMFKKYLSEDILRDVRRKNPALDIDYNEDIYNQALILIEDITLNRGGKLLTEFGLTSPRRDHSDALSTEILRETSYHVERLADYVRANVPKLNADQRTASEKIRNAVNASAADSGLPGQLFFLDVPGGTGKTFLISLLLAYFRSKRSCTNRHRCYLDGRWEDRTFSFRAATTIAHPGDSSVEDFSCHSKRPTPEKMQRHHLGRVHHVKQKSS